MCQGSGHIPPGGSVTGGMPVRARRVVPDRASRIPSGIALRAAERRRGTKRLPRRLIRSFWHVGCTTPGRSPSGGSDLRSGRCRIPSGERGTALRGGERPRRLSGKPAAPAVPSIGSPVGRARPRGWAPHSPNGDRIVSRPGERTGPVPVRGASHARGRRDPGRTRVGRSTLAGNPLVVTGEALRCLPLSSSGRRPGPSRAPGRRGDAAQLPSSSRARPSFPSSASPVSRASASRESPRAVRVVFPPPPSSSAPRRLPSMDTSSFAPNEIPRSKVSSPSPCAWSSGALSLTAAGRGRFPRSA